MGFGRVWRRGPPPNFPVSRCFQYLKISQKMTAYKWVYKLKHYITYGLLRRSRKVTCSRQDLFHTHKTHYLSNADVVQDHPHLRHR